MKNNWNAYSFTNFLLWIVGTPLLLAFLLNRFLPFPAYLMLLLSILYVSFGQIFFPFLKLHCTITPSTISVPKWKISKEEIAVIKLNVKYRYGKYSNVRYTLSIISKNGDTYDVSQLVDVQAARLVADLNKNGYPLSLAWAEQLRSKGKKRIIANLVALVIVLLYGYYLISRIPGHPFLKLFGF